MYSADTCTLSATTRATFSQLGRTAWTHLLGAQTNAHVCNGAAAPQLMR
jgi:hypothetical protein